MIGFGDQVVDALFVVDPEFTVEVPKDLGCAGLGGFDQRGFEHTQRYPLVGAYLLLVFCGVFEKRVL